jgi:hypothetical protein
MADSQPIQAIGSFQQLVPGVVDPARCFPPFPPRITVVAALKATAAYFGISLDELASPSRKQPLVWRRQVAMFVARKLTRRSFPVIAEKLGRKDHTTVLHGVRAVQARIDAGDAATVGDVGAIVKQLIEGDSMADLSEDERLAEEHGATFLRSANGLWWVRDRQGVTIIRAAQSRVEAARLYCEDQDLNRNTPEAILARIKAQYRPYDTLPEFQEGFDAYRQQGAYRRDPYESEAGYKAQAWARGANAAMLYQRALEHLDKCEKLDGAAPDPGWLARLIQTGRA